jgi:hypothetical protein
MASTSVSPERRGGARASRRLTRRRALVLLGALVVAFGLIQLVPYRVSNPPVGQEPPWDSPQTRELAVAACFDCHSNQTRSYWYERIAPVSWWITSHVDNGRSALNFSEWGKTEHEGAEAAEVVLEGSMPPNYYYWLGLHDGAKLTKAQRRQLADGLRKTLGASRASGD